jgi:hypothetical protein
LTRRKDSNGREKVVKPEYRDTPIDRLFIRLFSRKMARVLGRGTSLKGYDGFVDLSKHFMRGRNAREQQEAIARVLRSLIPPPILWIVRTFFFPTQLVCELNAWFATVLFEWLVGPCEVKAVTVVAPDGTTRQQNSGVRIQKCRYLEDSQCVGMCVNMCKLPTQDFFLKEFGIPLTMTPNFEDLSCEMIFGQVPPPLEEESAYHQPCLMTRCSMANSQAESCPKVRN